MGWPQAFARSNNRNFLPFRTSEASLAGPKGGLSPLHRINATFPVGPIPGGAFARVFQGKRAFFRNPYHGRIAQSRLSRTLRTRASLSHRLAGLRR